MHEALHAIRLNTPAISSVRPKKGGRDKSAPFTLSEEPPPAAPEAEAEAEAGEPAAASGTYARLDVGHRLDDEEGQKIDVTA